jgi:hypothetical protein
MYVFAKNEHARSERASKRAGKFLNELSQYGNIGEYLLDTRIATISDRSHAALYGLLHVDVRQHECWNPFGHDSRPDESGCEVSVR